MKQLRIIVLSVLNAMQIGFTFFVLALGISSLASSYADAGDINSHTDFLSLVMISGVFGLIAFFGTSPFCYMNGRKGKSYPFIKFHIFDFFETFLRGL